MDANVQKINSAVAVTSEQLSTGFMFNQWLDEKLFDDVLTTLTIWNNMCLLYALKGCSQSLTRNPK